MPSDSQPLRGGGDDRGLSLFGGAGWTFFTSFVILTALGVTSALKPAKAYDLVNNQICFGLGLALSIFLIVRIHLPSRALPDALGARPVPVMLYVIAFAAGLSLQVPATGLDNLIDRLAPHPAEDLAALEMTALVSTFHRVVFAVVATVIGPFFEEMFCRGVLFRALRRTSSGPVTVVATALAFAFLHMDPRLAAVAFGCGLVLGYLREVTGSVLVPLAAHAAFNAVVAVAVAAGWLSLSETQTPMSWAALAGGSALLVLLLALVGAVARRSELSRAARAEDAR